jgi:hypothetical protein
LVLQRVGLYYPVACFLMNCITCMGAGNKTAQHVALDPPSFKEYIAYCKMYAPHLCGAQV